MQSKIDKRCNALFINVSEELFFDERKIKEERIKK